MSKMISFATLNDANQRLLRAAQNVAQNGYAPYSGFAVGAAVRAIDGEIFSGANLENAVYGLGMCAEVSAITAANSAGHYNLEAIAVVGYRFTEPRDASQVVTPCGRCRQLIFEAAQISDVDIRVLSCSGDLSRVVESTISELLPEAFGPKNLGLTASWLETRRKLLATDVGALAQVSKLTLVPGTKKR